MSGEKPLVTIGIAVYNGADHILQTLASINNQTYQNIEIVIVDDCSKDNSYEICRRWEIESSFPIAVCQNKSNLRLPATRNVLLEKSRGKYLCLFDQDDMMLPDKIESDVLVFEEQKNNVALIYSDLNLMDEAGNPFGKGYFERIGFKGRGNDDLFKELIQMNFIPAPSVMVRSELLKKVGGYDESLQFDDWDIWLRLAKEYEFVYSGVINVFYRIHNSSMMANKHSGQTSLRNKANMKMFEKHLGLNNDYDEALYKKLKELAVYSYFIGDKDSAKILGNYLKKKFDSKIWFYHKMAFLGIKHSSAWLKKSG
jgi:glycosyltransferase involved in cell wall biosynthesis